MPILLYVALVNFLFFEYFFLLVTGFTGNGYQFLYMKVRFCVTPFECPLKESKFQVKCDSLKSQRRRIKSVWFLFSPFLSSVWEQYCFTPTLVKLAQWITIFTGRMVLEFFLIISEVSSYKHM